jgi:hypothetical protein
MRTLRGFLALVLLLGTVPVVWAQADPAKEVADIRAKQGAAGAKGEANGARKWWTPGQASAGSRSAWRARATTFNSIRLRRACSRRQSVDLSAKYQALLNCPVRNNETAFPSMYSFQK